MEAKVLRAALLAAIRVTVSSSMLGCGGATTFDQPGPMPSSPEEPEPQQSSGGGGTASQPTAHNSAGTHPASASAGGGVGVAASGGSGGLGEAGMPGGAGAPAASGSFCDGPAIQACEPIYDELAASTEPWSVQLSDVAVGCCKVLVDALDRVSPPEVDAQCLAELDSRLNLLRGSCCRALEFQGTCAPWGPPVPPELELELLLSWGAVA
jgi:hypothetical protein